MLLFSVNTQDFNFSFISLAVLIVNAAIFYSNGMVSEEKTCQSLADPGLVKGTSEIVSQILQLWQIGVRQAKLAILTNAISFSYLRKSRVLFVHLV